MPGEGNSKATKCALENLHRYGFLRIAKREKGIRVYGVATPSTKVMSNQERLEKLVLVLANIFAPVPQKTLRSLITRYRYLVPEFKSTQAILDDLHLQNKLSKLTIDGCTFVWPTEDKVRKRIANKVRILAPFDPLVWDRYRFEIFWGWAYRFEAYTPIAKRVRGYYAMPLLWKEDIIGWANANVAKGSLDIEFGFVNKRPRSKDFTAELEAEVERLKHFLISRKR